MHWLFLFFLLLVIGLVFVVRMIAVKSSLDSSSFTLPCLFLRFREFVPDIAWQ